MDEEKYQKELFEFEKPKRGFPRLSDLLPKPDFDNRMTVMLTLERVVFIAIGLIMAMVVVYALGVESGKRYAKKESSETRISLIKAPQIPVAARTLVSAAPMPKIGATTPPVPSSMAVAGKPYTIFAASFSHRDYADLAVNKLRGAGFDAFLVQSGNLFRLCVGTYSSADAAQKDFLKVKRIYKDAFVKTR